MTSESSAIDGVSAALSSLHQAFIMVSKFTAEHGVNPLKPWL